MRVRLAFYLGMIWLVCQGCAPLGRAGRTSIVQPFIYPRWLNEFADCSRNRKLAQSAWAKFVCNSTSTYSPDFEKGFKDGFADYLFWGGTGAPPPVPPRCYWNSKYETPEGHQAIEDWFAGFRAGAESAHATGYRELVLVPASTSLPPLMPPPQLPSSSPSGASPGSGVGPEEVLPPPRPVPGPGSTTPSGPPPTGGSPGFPSPRSQGALPAPDETSRKANPSAAILLEPQALSGPSRATGQGSTSPLSILAGISSPAESPTRRSNDRQAGGEANAEKWTVGTIIEE